MILRVLFLFCFSILHSQSFTADIEVRYNLDYKLDPSSPVPRNEEFTLFLKDSESLFLSQKVINLDSLPSGNSGNPNKELITLAGNRTYFGEKIHTSKNQVTTFYFNEGVTLFFSEDESAEWILEKEEKQMGQLKCQIASAKMYGRSWKACYSTEYPFQFGPYKFHGLPGLIIDLVDSENIYHYSLIELKKSSKVVSKPEKNLVRTSRQKYFQLVNDLKYGGTLFDKINFVDKTEILKISKNRKDRSKKESNFPIDKDMRYIFE